MDKMQLSKDRHTLEAEDISGRIFIYIDDKPFVKLNFSRKLRIYFDCISNESQAFTAESHSHGKASLESNGSFLKGELSYSHSKEKDQKLKKYVVNNQKKENTLCFSNTVKNKTQSFEQPIEQTFKSEVINLDAPLPAEFLHAPYACSTTTTFSSTDNTTFSSLQLQCPKKTFPQPESSCSYCHKAFLTCSEKEAHHRVPDCVHDKSLKGSLSDIENSVDGLSSNTFIRCPLCQKQTNQLEEHIAVFHINEMLFQCCVCGQKFLTDLKLRRHCYRHLKKTTGKFHCSRCPMVTDDRSVFLRHAATHRTECAICNTDFGHTHLLWSHYQSQHADKLFTCKTCGKKVATKDQFDTHMNYHRFSSKPCPICGIMIKSNLNKHLQRKHPEMNQTSTSQHSDNQHTCSKCFKTFSSHVNLSEHLRRNHHNQVACPNCGKKFSKKAYLTKHIDRVHLNMDVYTYICEICGKRATSSYNLKVHKRVHSTSKMFSCDLCGQGFNYKASLQGHHLWANDKTSGDQTLTRVEIHLCKAVSLFVFTFSNSEPLGFQLAIAPLGPI
ncbi:hypothetical protein RRG08_003439 [Elysia crispata]|uniref:C2H2-type domain-containing protein n=1 Tax=Elysia crispata TaxID=231223 RepID=A0AAE1ACP4_9GAST|nr:hypothetical protein RRG08_003439 [Elysia crispata]